MSRPAGGLPAATRELPAIEVNDDAGRLRLVRRLLNPLYHTGYALTLNTLGTAALGFIFWAIAAHLYGRQAVGRSSALLSALILMSTLTQFSLNIVLQRYLPQAGNAARRLIGISYAVCSLAALPVAIGFVLLMPRLSTQWQFLANSPTLSLIFIAAGMIWAIFSLEDDALIGLRHAIVVPIENAIYGVLKLVLLVCIAGLLHSAGIFVSYVLPLLVVIPVVNWLIFRHYASLDKDAGKGAVFRAREIARFASVDYLATLLNQAYGSLLPLLVLSVLGATVNGGFYIAWTIAAVPTMVAVNFSTSLIVEAMTTPGRLAYLTRGTLMRSLAVTALGALVLGAGGRLILSIYGSSYAHRDYTLIALLALATIPRSVVVLSWSLDQVAGRVSRAVVTQAVLAVLVLGGSRFLVNQYGVLGVGFAWTGANFAIAIVRLPTIISAARPRPAVATRSTADRALIGGSGMRSWKLALALAFVLGMGIWSFAIVGGHQQRSPGDGVKLPSFSRIAQAAVEQRFTAPTGAPEFIATFTGSRLKRSVWGTCYPTMDLRTGCSNFGSSEYQWYLPAQDRVVGQALRLTARRTPTAGKAKNGKPRVYACRSGVVTTYPGFRFRFGYIQVVAFIPAGSGLRPALTLAPANGASAPQIDLVEGWGKTRSHKQTAAAIFQPVAQSAVKARLPATLLGGWHTFAASWKQSQLTWLVDGKQVLTIRQGVPQQAMYFLANLAEYSDPTRAGECNGSLLIRSVKVWKD